MNILVTGGAGYIGSHMVRHLQDLNIDVTVIDDFSTGNRWSLSSCEVLEIDLKDKLNLNKALSKKSFDGVIHFAAYSLVEESMQNPLKYFNNNIIGSLNLLDWMINNNVSNLVFSSTAAIYGNPISRKINEEHPKNPINIW